MQEFSARFRVSPQNRILDCIGEHRIRFWSGFVQELVRQGLPCALPGRSKERALVLLTPDQPVDRNSPTKAVLMKPDEVDSM